MTGPLILGSALKRGHADDDILHAVRCRIRVFEEDGMTMFIGPARNGLLLEVGVVEAADFDGQLIVHCMSARPKYLGKGWKGR